MLLKEQFVCAVITKSVLSGRLAADCMNQSHLHIVHKELEASSWTWRETFCSRGFVPSAEFCIMKQKLIL